MNKKLIGWDLKIGDKIKIISENENYSKYMDQIWTINYIDYDGSSYGFDESIGQVLVSCEGLPFSLYPYEFSVVERKNKRRMK